VTLVSSWLLKLRRRKNGSEHQPQRQLNCIIPVATISFAMPPTQYTYPSFNLKDVVKGPVIKGDDDLIGKIVEAAQDPDDPPVIFAWKEAALAAFMAKIAALPPGAPSPPPSLTPPPHAGDGLGNGLHDLIERLLVHLQTLVPGCAIIGGAGGVAGLACSQLQSMNVCCALRGLELDPWFAAVIAGGPVPLPSTLATVLVPRARVTTGVCDPLAVNCTLWS
jgi:hypothetical protein